MRLSLQKQMYDVLQKAFSPTRLEIVDDSAKHVGHAENVSGAGHYTVIIGAECFKNKSRLAIHREIYAALRNFIPSQIHALQIKLTK